MDFHSQSKDAVLQELHTDATQGLSASEAEARQARYGKNQLTPKKPKSLWQRFLAQFRDAMILILLAAAAVSLVIAIVEQNPGDLFEPFLILLIVIVNAIMGVVQESKAEKALEALKNMSAPHSRVIREGTECVIDAADLVPGDLIRLEAGDFVPADARLLYSSGLKSEESALTGESLPAEKDANASVAADAPLGDRSTMIYSGCSITYGTASAVVTATGMQTEMGKIANLLQGEGEDTETPLQKKLSQLGKYLGFLAIGICAVIFVIGLFNQIPPLEIFMTAVSLAVSAIPEGLPAIVTVVLSIGVQRLAKKHAIIRRLPAVETLGGASVICSDKTGTLTQNRMTVVKAFLADGSLMEDVNAEHKNSENVCTLLNYGTLCCNGSLLIEDDHITHIGDPTETAILYASHCNGFSQSALQAEFPRLAELPFDSDRKLMTTVHLVHGKKLVIVKGAVDMMIPRCTNSAEQIAAIQAANETMSASALRVLAIAVKEIDTLPQEPTGDTLECDLTLIGLLGMIDPPREEVAAAVRVCRSAGIRPVMITGDHVVTASAIAKSLGILQPGQRAITGAELDAMSEEELREQVAEISVYARVSPENKIRIVKAWQSRGDVVAMTGDGVNDAPALKAADIGCAMGITGTDVAKGAADMTLSDDNFSTIVDAVREGRGIYTNIKKVVGFLLGTNIGEVITVFVAMLIWHKSPLLSMQLLWINLVTDSLPAIALGMEAVESDVMERAPRPRSDGLFSNGYGIRIALQGVLFGSISLLAYGLGLTFGKSESAGQTMAFMVLSMSQIVQAYNMRSEHSLFRLGLFTNKNLNKAALVSLVLTALVVFIPPIANIFGLVALSWQLYLAALGLILLPFVVMELAKAMRLIRHESHRTPSKKSK